MITYKICKEHNKILKVIIMRILAKLSANFLFATSMLSAMEITTDPMTASSVGIATPRIEATIISADKRLDHVKNIIVRNPDLTMRTQLPELIETFWKPDFAYARTQIEKQDGKHLKKDGTIILARPFQSEVLQAFDVINDMVLENQDLMSFGDLCMTRSNNQKIC